MHENVESLEVQAFEKKDKKIDKRGKQNSVGPNSRDTFKLMTWLNT